MGAGASRHLVNALARAGGGRAEFIAPGERSEKKVMRQVGRALAAQTRNLQVDWGGLHVQQSPSRIASSFAGEPLVVCALIDNARPTRVVLRGEPSDRGILASLDFNPDSAPEGNLLATLAARGLIRDLEEGTSPLQSAQGSRQTDRKEPLEQRVRERLLELGKAYNLTSSVTSLVAIEERQTPTTQAAELRRVLVALTRGWGGQTDHVLGISHSRVGMAAASGPSGVSGTERPSRLFKRIESPGRRDTYYDLKARVMDKILSKLDPSLDHSRVGEARRTIEEHFENALTKDRIVLSRPERGRLYEQIVAEILGSGSAVGAFDARDATTTDVCGSMQTVDAKLAGEKDDLTTQLLLQQQADGAWHLSRRLLALIGVAASPEALALSLHLPPTDEQATQTLAAWLAIVWLERNAMPERDTWRLAAAKARRWLERYGSTAPAGTAWEEVAAGVLTR
jgi:hypothetical protein